MSSPPPPPPPTLGHAHSPPPDSPAATGGVIETALLRPSRWLPSEVPWSAAAQAKFASERGLEGPPDTANLLQLEACLPPVEHRVPAMLAPVHTPLFIPAWERELATHPDRDRVSYLLNGLRNGFRIGYNYRHNSCRSRARNMASASMHSQVVEEYLRKECSAGRVVGPLSLRDFPSVQVSPFGVTPKSTPGKWRLIVDLSSPHGGSVNDGIDRNLCSLTYSKVDDIAELILHLGIGARLAKIDIQEAYRIVPVHPQDRLLLGMTWQGQLYVDTAFPFGLRSAPKIFDTVARALEWIFRQKGVMSIRHYLR